MTRCRPFLEYFFIKMENIYDGFWHGRETNRTL